MVQIRIQYKTRPMNRGGVYSGFGGGGGGPGISRTGNFSDRLMIFDIYFWTLALCVFAIILLIIIVYKMNRDHVTCQSLLALSYMDTVRTMKNFTDADGERWLATFVYTRDLNGDQERLWEIDYDIYSEKCIEGMCMMSLYLDPKSIYYQDHTTVLKLRFLCRLLYVRIKERLQFYETEQTYFLFTAFIICMHLWCGKPADNVMVEYFNAHMKGFNLNECKYSLMELVDYYQYSKLSKNFVYSLSLVNRNFKV